MSATYEIVNPSDPYSIDGDREAICAAVLLLGNGWYAVEGADGERVLPILALCPGDRAEAWWREHCRGSCSRRRGKPGELRGRPPTGLVALLARLPAGDTERLNALSRRTGVPRATLIREAVADLLTKYEAAP